VELSNNAGSNDSGGFWGLHGLFSVLILHSSINVSNETSLIFKMNPFLFHYSQDLIETITDYPIIQLAVWKNPSFTPPISQGLE
jgi:hypothetical protein